MSSKPVSREFAREWQFNGLPTSRPSDELFERMTTAELEAYAHDSALPQWFTSTVGATAGDNEES